MSGRGPDASADESAAGTSLLPPREHPFWQADDCAETVIQTVMELEAQIDDAERIVTEQEARPDAQTGHSTSVLAPALPP